LQCHWSVGPRSAVIFNAWKSRVIWGCPHFACYSSLDGVNEGGVLTSLNLTLNLRIFCAAFINAARRERFPKFTNRSLWKSLEWHQRYANLLRWLTIVQLIMHRNLSENEERDHRVQIRIWSEHHRTSINSTFWMMNAEMRRLSGFNRL
jgi:hypothetical protein